MLAEIELRPLFDREVAVHREHCNSYPDSHLAVLLRVFPKFPEIVRFFESDHVYRRRQLLLVGAFSASGMVGTVAIQMNAPHQSAGLTDDEWGKFFGRFSQQELKAFDTWSASLQKTYLLAPANALTLHSLAVATDYRRKGLAGKLIDYAVSELSQVDRKRLFVETARQSYLVNLFAKHNFRVVRKSCSLSEWLEYGQWGSVLMQHNADG